MAAASQFAGASSGEIAPHSLVPAAVLAMAEKLRTSNPPKIFDSMKLLEQLLSHTSLPKEIEAKVRLQLSAMFLQYSKNVDIAKMHLEKAVKILFCQLLSK